MTASSTTSSLRLVRLRPPVSRSTLLLACALPCLLEARSNAGQPPSVLVVGLEAPAAQSREAARLTEALRQSLSRRSDLRVAPKRDLGEVRFLLGCEAGVPTEACLSRARGTLGADWIVFGELISGAEGPLDLRLRVLDGRSGAARATELRQALPAAALEGAPLDEASTRWLVTLLGPAPTVAGAATVANPDAGAPGSAAPGSPPPEALRPAAPGQTATSDDDIPWDDKPGRRLLAGGVVALVLSVAAFGISIATWRASQSAEPEAHDALARVAAADPAYAQANADLFAHPSCAIPPTTGPAQNAVEAYRGKCESGESYASATRALLGTGAVLGAVGVTTVVLGALRARDGRTSRPSAVRLGAAPGGLTLSF